MYKNIIYKDTCHNYGGKDEKKKVFKGNRVFNWVDACVKIIACSYLEIHDIKMHTLNTQ